jgi:hypothetical protein
VNWCVPGDEAGQNLGGSPPPRTGEDGCPANRRRSLARWRSGSTSTWARMDLLKEDFWPPT